MSKMTHHRWQFSTFLLIGMIISACVPIIKHEQPSRTDLVELSRGENIGQTFLARYSGLDGIEIYINPESIVEGELFLYLYPHPQNTSKELIKGSLSLGNISTPGYYRIPIPSLRESFNKDYYLQLEIEGQSKLKLATAPGNAYLNGALYQNGIPQDTQLSFRLTYNPIHLYLGLFSEVLKWIAMLFVGFWLYIIPGWALLSLTLPKWASLRWAEKFALSAGVSLAIYPIILLWTDLVGLHLGPLYAWLPPIVGFLVIVWRNQGKFVDLLMANTRKKTISAYRLSSITYIKSPSDWLPDILLLIILLLVFVTRFWVIRNLDTPMWGDSYQHTIIAQLIVENGGLFNSWAPYADLTTFTYHFGFHTLVSNLHWITGMSMPQAVLWTGQILNGLAVFSLYPLAVRVGRTRWAGIIALLVAGLLLSMPMFYVNWGRYTQLTGLIILASFAYIAWVMLTGKSMKPGIGILLGIILAGLALTHYRILLLALLFFPAFIIIFAREFGWISILSRSLISGLLAGLLFLPWFIHVFAGKIIRIFSHQLTILPSNASSPILQTNAVGNLFNYLPPIIWLLLPFIIGWGLWKREKGVALISLWWFLIFIITNPQWLGLPGSGAITNFTIFIAAYFPASILIGYAAGRILHSLAYTQNATGENHSSYRSAYLLGVIFIILFLGIWGAKQRLKDVQPAKHALVTRPDIRAADWIQANSKQNERYLVNSFFAFGGTVIVGSDAGWWLPLFAGQNTTLPPINYIFEEGTRPDYQEWVNTLTAEIQAKGINHPDVLAELTARGITNIYLGQQGGSVNYAGPQALNPGDLLSSPYYHPIYHQDQVWIFAVVQ